MSAASSPSGQGIIQGFRSFIARGSMVDMAVGVVMGSAVTAVVNAIVKSFITPLIGMIFGKQDLSSLLTITANGATISFGAILAALVNFLCVAAAVYFFIIVPINKLHDLRHRGETPEQAPAPTPEEQNVALLREIRDQLSAR